MDKCVLYTDGASKGNPGDAGIGIVISEPDGTVIREIGEYIGKATNNVAEYKALIRGLQECHEMGATSVEINTDSELLARQISGFYKVKSERLKPLHGEAMSILRHFRAVSISHVAREFNRRADELANEGVRKKGRPPAKRRSEKPAGDGRGVQGELGF